MLISKLNGIHRKHALRQLDMCVDLTAIFHKGDNFCDFLFVLLQPNALLKKGSTLQGKNLLRKQICSLYRLLFRKG